MIGYESDEYYENHVYPNRVVSIIGSSPFWADRGKAYLLIGSAETTFYRKTDNGAKVFAASGQQWAWGLDDWGANPDYGPVIGGRLSSRRPEAEKLTENVMNCLINQVPACDN